MPTKDYSKLPVIVCATCGKEFKRPKPGQGEPKYCCRECYNISVSKRQLGENNPSWKGGVVEIVCVCCGKKTYQYPSKRDRKYCSYECHLLFNEYSKRKDKKCPACGEMFKNNYSPSKERKYCSAECWRKKQSLRQQGKESHLWQGGKVQGVRRLRNHPLYKEWRTAVFQRDDYTCLSCGERGGNLTAHHIVTISKNPRKALRISNGMTLCRECHSNVHWPERSKADNG